MATQQFYSPTEGQLVKRTLKKKKKYNAEKSSHLCDRQVSALPRQFVSICSHFHTQIPFPPVGMLLTLVLSGLAEHMACMYDNLRSLCCDLTSTPSCFLVCYSEMSPLDGTRNASCSHSTIDRNVQTSL